MHSMLNIRNHKQFNGLSQISEVAEHFPGGENFIDRPTINFHSQRSVNPVGIETGSCKSPGCKSASEWAGTITFFIENPIPVRVRDVLKIAAVYVIRHFRGGEGDGRVGNHVFHEP